MNNVSGEVCNGIAYIDWGLLHERNVTGKNSPLRRCFGSYRQIEKLPTQIDLQASVPSNDARTRYVRAIGSTAIFYSPVDKRAFARSLGPIDTGGASEVGIVEEALLEWSIRVRDEGAEKVICDPTKELLDRTIAIAQRSVSMAIVGVNPIGLFFSKMKERIPELVRETYAIATSIRVEIRISDPSDGKKYP